jgi:hypothetical protein
MKKTTTLFLMLISINLFSQVKDSSYCLNEFTLLESFNPSNLIGKTIYFPSIVSSDKYDTSRLTFIISKRTNKFDSYYADTFINKSFKIVDYRNQMDYDKFTFAQEAIFIGFKTENSDTFFCPISIDGEFVSYMPFIIKECFDNIRQSYIGLKIKPKYEIELINQATNQKQKINNELIIKDYILYKSNNGSEFPRFIVSDSQNTYYLNSQYNENTGLHFKYFDIIK